MFVTRLTWSDIGQGMASGGVERVVLYHANTAHPWDGVLGIDESPQPIITPTLYSDGTKQQDRQVQTDYQAVIAAYTYPDVLDETEVVGAGLSYRSDIYDFQGDRAGYRLHIVYGARLTPTELRYTTGESPIGMGWGVLGDKRPIPDAMPGSHIYIDTTLTEEWAVRALEDVLYGTESSEPRLPEPEEIFGIFSGTRHLIVIDHGDGQYTADGPDDVVRMIGPDMFEISWFTAQPIDQHRYTVSSS